MEVKKYKIQGSNDPKYKGAVNFIIDNKRRWVRDKKIFDQYGLTWPDDVNWVTANVLDQYDLGAMVPYLWDSKDLNSIPETVITDANMREYLGAQLSGNGIEFGAAASPYPVPVDCHVEYADLYKSDNLKTRIYLDGEYEFVNNKYVMSFDSMTDVEDQSQDFIIACHVIEHVRNPLNAMKQAYEKLKAGGKLLLVIPHHNFTLDKDRELSPVDHIIEDYKKPSKDRDFEHYLDYYSKAEGYVVEPENLESTARDSQENKEGIIHYHVWNEETFAQTLEYFQNNIYKWNNIKIIPRVDHKDAYEFYCICEK